MSAIHAPHNSDRPRSQSCGTDTLTVDCLPLARVTPMESDSIESEFTGPCILPVGQERSQVTRFKKMEPRKYIHTAIASRISPRNPPVKNFSLALTTNGILSGRCSILALCLLGGIES